MDNKTDISNIYKEFREPLKAFIGKRLHDQASTEDLVHDVFLRIHNQIGALKDEEKLVAWIYQIARNAVVDFYRRKKETMPQIEDIAFEKYELNEMPEKLAHVVRSMVDRLPEKYKQALFLADFEGLKQSELAKKLGISLSGAKSRVQRARRMLKELLLECCHFEFDRYGTIFDYYPKNCHNCCEGNGKKKSCSAN